MNDRVKILGPGIVSISRNAYHGRFETILKICDRELHISDARNLPNCSWDRVGLEALRECINCWLGTGGFGAQDDTSPYPYIGKKMLLRQGGVAPVPVTLCHHEAILCRWYVKDANGPFSELKSVGADELLPLKELVPEPKYRQYTPQEMAGYFGRRLQWALPIMDYRLASVSEWYARFHDSEHGSSVEIKYEDLVKTNRWYDGEVCGVKEPVWVKEPVS